jgi:nucleotide-binding universal stress UspA family protein
MHKLLVAVDGSDSSNRALDYALRLAAECGGEIHLLNVNPDPLVYGEIQVYVPMERMVELQRQHSETVLGPAVRKADAAGVRQTSEIATGDAASVISECAIKQKCDGIIMGTRGMGAVGNLLLGSVATKVVHLATVPVTLVK